MTTREKIISLARECRIKVIYATSKNTSAVKDGFSMSGYAKHFEAQPENIEAFYHAARNGALEEAAIAAEEATADMRFQQLRDYDFAARIARTIRSMKETK